MKVFSIRDTAVEAFMRPFFARTAGEADRAFSGEVQNAQTPVGQHPADYHLFYLGDFDEVTGDLTPLDAPVRISSALDHIHRAPELEHGDQLDIKDVS